MAHQRESPVAVDDIALERSASDAHNKLLENREYCIIFRALAAKTCRFRDSIGSNRVLHS